MADETNPFDQFDNAPAETPVANPTPVESNPFDRFDKPSVTAPLTVYTPGKGNKKMEGGFETSSGAPMNTLEAFERGDAPYVTGAVHPDSPLRGKSLDVKIGEKVYPMKITDTGPGVATIDVASEHGSWANNAPAEFQNAEVSRSDGEHFDNPFDKFGPRTMSFPEEIEAVRQAEKDHPVFTNAMKAASEYITGMIPKNETEYAASLFPPLQAFLTGQAIAHGDVSGIPIVGRIPEIREAERTPPFSKERFLAGIKMTSDVLLVAGLGKMAGGIEAATPIKSIGSEPPVIPPTEPPAMPVSPEIPGASYEVPLPVKGSGKFVKSYSVDKRLGDMMEGIGASRESGAFDAEIASRQLLDDLSEKQQEDFGRYLVSRRLKTVNPDHPQILSEADMVKIESDPEIAKSINTYVTDIKPAIESLRKRAGLSEQAAAGKEPEFISLQPKTDELLPGVAGELGPTTRASRLPRHTKYAQHAAGLAKEYNTNLREVLRESYSEATRKANVADFYKEVQRKGLSASEKFEDLPPELQHDLRAATETKLQPSGAIKAWHAIQRSATSVALTANPAELLNHMRRQLNVLAAKPPVGRGLLARMEVIIPYIGPKTGSFIRAVTDNMSKPSNVAVLRDIFRAGGGSSRSFSEMYQLRGSLSKWSGLQWLQRQTHKLLFGLPEGRGVGGWDLRMRVQLEKIRRASEPWAANDPQRMREFANQIGQYGAHPSWTIDFLKNLNPYAATTVPMRATELKQAIGVSGLKSQSIGMRSLRILETQLRGTGGTILGLTAANKLLSGRWPWENDPGHEFDLNTGTTGPDGKRIYLKFRVIAPELSRPVATIGLPALSRESTADTPQHLDAFMTSLINQGLSIVGGPAQNALWTALTGTAAYRVKQPGKPGEMMDLAKTEEGGSRGLSNLKAAASQLNPSIEGLAPSKYHPDVPMPLKFLDIPGLRPFGPAFSTSYDPKESNKPRKQLTLKQIRARERRKNQ